MTTRIKYNRKLIESGEAVYIGRGFRYHNIPPSKWGNPFTMENTGRVPAVLRFACEIAPLWDVTELRGKNLACWCSLDQECHADVLLELANKD